MTEFLFSNNLLKIHTNKNSSVFSLAGESIYNKISGKYGIIYDDYDCNKDIIQSWKSDKLQTIFTNAPRRKTIHMDDKILFHKRMIDSIFTPESYLTVDEITDKDGLFFVKETNSTGGKGVHIYNYDTLQTINVNNCVLQKNISNPDLYNNKRYKIRQLVLLYNKNLYLYKNGFFTCSNVIYNTDVVDLINNLRDMHVINQKHDTLFELNSNLENFESIHDNIQLAVRDFKKYYSKEIDTIEGNEYVVLGFDFIVDVDKNVQIIEINHRSNYSHPKNVSIECDVGFFKDMMLLLINGEMNDLILV